MNTYSSKIISFLIFSISSYAQLQLSTQLKCTEGKVRFVLFVDRTSANDGGKIRTQRFIANEILAKKTLQNFYIEPRQNNEISSTGLIFDNYWDKVLLEISSDERTSDFLSLDQQKDIGKLSDAIFKVQTDQVGRISIRTIYTNRIITNLAISYCN